MKKIIIINDIHGNFKALKTVMDHLKETPIDLFIFTGDLIGMGASSNEVIQLIKKINNKIVIKGNHEDYLITGNINKFSCLEMLHHQWQKDHLTKENIAFIQELDDEQMIQIENLSLYITHYPKINGEVTPIIHDNDYQAILKLFKFPKQDLIIFGHNHHPQIIDGKQFLINVGSLGCSNIHPGFTRFGLLTINENKHQLEIIELKYDIDSERQKLIDLNVPDHELINKVFFKKG